MRLWAAVLAAAVLLLLMSAGNAGASISKYIGSYGTTNYEEYDRINIFVNNASLLPCWVNYTCEGDCYQLQPNWPSSSYCYHRTYVYDIYMGGAWNVQNYGGTVMTAHTSACGYGSSWSTYSDSVVFRSTSDYLQGFPWTADCTQCAGYHTKFHVTVAPYETECSLSGTIGCIGTVSLYWDHDDDGTYDIVENQYYDNTTYASYSFDDITCGEKYAAQYDYADTYFLVPSGHHVNDVGTCPDTYYIYGYTCGIGDIHLYRDDGGWVLVDSVAQSMRLSDYEMPIMSGNDYKLNMHGISQLVDSYLFSCTGDHVLYIYDRCVYPPGPHPDDPVDPIIIWEGYDYNIVVFRDEHGNRVENAQVAVYDKTNSTYIQRWTPNPDGYLLLGALFNDSDHAVQVLMRTFDGVFTLETTYPANGSAIVGEEDVTQTNMTIPIHYNILMHPVDNASMPIPGVFCGLSEYTPYDPLSFWGMSMYGRTTVPVSGCSGFSMCDLFAEKGGYTTYNVTALNWTSRSAMVKDYRHTVTMGAQTP